MLAGLKDKRVKGLQGCVEQLRIAGRSKEGTPLQQSESGVVDLLGRILQSFEEESG